MGRGNIILLKRKANTNLKTTNKQVYSLLFATENTDGTKACLNTIKKKIIETCAGSNVIDELRKYFDRFDEDKR